MRCVKVICTHAHLYVNNMCSQSFCTLHKYTGYLRFCCLTKAVPWKSPSSHQTNMFIKDNLCKIPKNKNRK